MRISTYMIPACITCSATWPQKSSRAQHFSTNGYHLSINSRISDAAVTIFRLPANTSPGYHHLPYLPDNMKKKHSFSSSITGTPLSGYHEIQTIHHVKSWHVFS
jgi:hypothetical protein